MRMYDMSGSGGNMRACSTFPEKNVRSIQIYLRITQKRYNPPTIYLHVCTVLDVAHMCYRHDFAAICAYPVTTVSH